MDLHYCTECGTKLETKTKKGILRKYCNHCGTYRYRNPMAAVAGIILNEKGKILLGRRSSDQTYPGTWCIPCGHIEWGEDIRDALVREMKEETGLLIVPRKVYNVHSNFHAAHALSVGCWFLCEVLDGQLIAGDDVDKVGYFGYGEIPELAFPTDRYVLDELHHDGLLID